MKLGYTILYVDDVAATLTQWEQAFGLTRRFLHESGIYGEMETGDTTLSFAEREFGRAHFTDDETRAMFDSHPRLFEIGLVTDDVQAAWEVAIRAGVRGLVAPKVQPWGQTVCWLRESNGILVELASPM